MTYVRQHYLGTRRRSFLWLAAAGVLLVVAGAVALVVLRPAHATVSSAKLRAVAVTCGQTITTSTTVTNDLTGCADKGLIIGANNIILDLGGHTIAGDGAAVGGDNGVENAGFDNVTVRNGTITQFAYGVVLHTSSNGNRVQNIRAHDNGVGIAAVGGEGTLVTGVSAFANDSFGILLQNAGAQLTNSSAAGNDQNGVLVQAAGSTVVVSGVKAVSNAWNGIVVSGLSGAEVKASFANSNNQDGIVMDAAGKLTGNTALFNTQLGVNAVPGVTDGGGNKAHDNGSPHQCANVVCT